MRSEAQRRDATGPALIVLAAAGLIAGLALGATPATRVAASRPASLVPNGDFEQPDPAGTLPAGWTTKHPGNVQLIDTGAPRGRVVEMTGDKDLMGTYGTDLVSPKIPVRANTRYRCTGHTKSAGPKMIVFVKGYATVTRRVNGRTQTFEDVVYQIRKDIETSADWRPFNLDFEIKPAGEFSDFQHRVEYLRITLWAYWPEGTCWYDDIRFEEVGPAAPRQRLHDELVTHVGTRPRLAETQPQTAPAAADLDEEQAWIDATNAWQENRFEDALRLAEQLIQHDPGRGDYRLLAARALARLQRWSQAGEHAKWLLAEEAAPRPPSTQPARRIEPWQRDWAKVVHAEVLLRTGSPAQARQLLKEVVDGAASPHARAAAQQLLAGQ